jgi:hypothetical protein
VIGAIAHEIMHKYFDAQEKVFKLENAEDVAVTIDALLGKYPIESKTTRKKIYNKSQIPEDWKEQLCIGMATMGSNKGFLMILNVISFAVMVFEFDLSDEELSLWKTVFVAKILLIAKSLKEKNPNMLEPKFVDCKWCPYRPMRKRTNWSGCPNYRPEKKS